MVEEGRFYTEEEPEDLRGVDVRLFLRELHHGRYAPAEASGIYVRSMERFGFSDQEMYDALRHQQLYLAEGNIPELTRSQMVRWDDFVICVEKGLGGRDFEFQDEDKLSKNRLVPVGTPSYDHNLEI